MWFNYLFFSQLFQIAHLGDNDDEPEFSSRIPLDEGETFFYDTRGLQNLILVDQIDSLNPMITSHVILLLNFLINFVLFFRLEI